MSVRERVRVTLIHNPGAGDERYSAKRILKELTAAGYDARLGSSKESGVEKALDDPGDLVVVAGGDGSIKRVAVALAGRGVPMAILPIGTANNIAKSFGILGTMQDLIASWREGARRRLALGTIATPWGTTRFVESVGVGVFTELVTRGEREVDQNTAGLTGHAIDRALLLLQRIIKERSPQFRHLEIDGSDRSGEYLLVEAMNMPLVGPNVPLAPDADYEDDRLEVVTVTPRERPALVEYVRARLSGGAAPPKLTVRKCRRVSMHASPDELHVDDQAWQPDQPTATGAPSPGLDQGEVAIGLDQLGIDVLVGPERIASAG